MSKSLWKICIAAVFLWAHLASVNVVAQCEGTEPCSFTEETCDINNGQFSIGEPCDECGCPYECVHSENQSAIGWCNPDLD
jgi:hypothetical protein